MKHINSRAENQIFIIENNNVLAEIHYWHHRIDINIYKEFDTKKVLFYILQNNLNVQPKWIKE